ncbi:MAG: hypothetical protein LBH03_04890 [Holophagales bacterium]|jgi:hypothetical protein|nr:hypothetical protein [Holophagales bacterium]
MSASYLCDLAGKYRSLSIIGMCKNAGKTTVLNHIIHNMVTDERLTAMTSIGRDGEAVDLVTGTAKPGIYIYAGFLIATAAGLLDSCDITKEFLLNTGISTPLGEIIVLRALSDGYVQLAGPSVVSQLEQLTCTFSQMGANRIIIDGAVNRKTLCSFTEAAILCTGASCGTSMDAIIKETLHVYKMLALPEINDDALRQLVKVQKKVADKIILCGRQHITLPSNVNIGEGLRENLLNNTTHVYVDGALSDSLVQSLLFSGADLSGVNLVVSDSGKILVSAGNYEKLRLRDSGIQVLNSVNLLAVTVNPFSVYGNNFDKDSFRAQLAGQIEVPVFNVEDA